MKELVKTNYSVYVATKLQNMTWRDPNTEKETQIATRGKGGQGKLLSLNFIPKERLRKHVVNAFISLLSPWHVLLLPSDYCSTRTSTVCTR